MTSRRTGEYTRGLAPSTGQALRSRLSPAGALQYTNRLRATLGTIRGAFGGFDSPDIATPGQFPSFGTSELQRRLDAGTSTAIDPNTPSAQPSRTNIRFGRGGLEFPEGRQFADLSPFDPKRQGAAGVPEGTDFWQLMEDELAALLAQRDAAIAEGRADVAAQYDEQIAALNDARAKLAAGRASINARYGEQQDLLRGQRATIAGQALAESGIRPDVEVSDITLVYGQAEEGLNDFLKLIDTANPTLARQLGADLTEFQILAENRLRSDLESQGAVLQAASKFAQKAGDLAAAQGLVDSETARVGLESDLTKRINAIKDNIDKLNKDKAAALAAVEEQVGEYDASFWQDPENVWGVYVDKYFDEQDLNFEQRGELMQLWGDVYFNLPTEQRTRAGAEQWARDDMFANNWEAILDRFNVDNEQDLQVALLNLRVLSGEGTSGYDAEADVERLIRAAMNPTQGAQFIEQLLGESIEGFVTFEDYEPLIDLIGLRGDFALEYEDFKDNLNAQLAGGNFSPSAVNGATLTRSDMAKVTAPSGSVGYIHPGAADNFNAMLAAAAADGIQLRFSDTYRSWASQAKAHRDFLRTGRNQSGQEVPWIAHPDKSNHPRGLAIDFTLSSGDAAHKWLKENAGRFGFGGIPKEAWHWEFRGSLDEPASSTPVSSPGGGGGDTRPQPL